MSAAGIDLQLRLGQRVRINDYGGQRVTGHVRGLSIDSDRVLTADVALERPIVIQPHEPGDRPIELWHQRVPAAEVFPLDERDELIAEMLAALQLARNVIEFDRGALADSHTGPEGLDDDGAAGVAEYDEALAEIDAAIAKATGSAS